MGEPATTQTVRTLTEGRIQRIILDRPPLNVLTITMLEELSQALAAIPPPGPEAPRVVTLEGAGKAFSAGVDIADHTADKVERMIETFHGVFEVMDGLQQPLVGLAHGAALGGGYELLLGCDIVIASDRAKLGQPEVQVGVFAPVAAARLPRRVGLGTTMELLLSGRAVRGEEAARLKLANLIFPAQEFQAQAQGYVRGLAALSGPVLAMVKAAVRLGATPAAQGGGLPPIERVYLQKLMKLSDAQEGLAAFMQRRKPEWTDS